MKQNPWLLLGIAFCSLIGLSGCAATGGGDEAPMTDEYGDPIGSAADEQMQMEDQMEDVTDSLIR